MIKLNSSILIVLLMLTGCASALKQQGAIYRYEKVAVLPPLVELRDFASGQDLQTPTERLKTQETLTTALVKRLRTAFNPEVRANEFEISKQLQRQVDAMFSQLRTVPSLSGIKLSDELKAYLTEQAGEGAALIVSYTGFHRAKDSMARGYHNSSFLTELTPKPVAEEKDRSSSLFVPYPNPHKALPEENSVTLQIAWFQGDQKILAFYNMEHSNQSPTDLEVAKTMATSVISGIKDCLKKSQKNAMK